MIKVTLVRMLNAMLIVFLVSSCASIKKNPEKTSTSSSEHSPAAKAITPAVTNSTGKIQHVNSEQFNKLLLLKEIQLVDVRTPEEFQSGHIQNALNIDVKDVNFKSNTNKLKKDKPVLVYCRSGKRSSDAAEILKELGFTKIVSLNGGILSWEEAKLPVSK